MTIEVQPGEMFYNVATKARQIAIDTNQDAVFIFNEIKCIVNKLTSIEAIQQDYDYMVKKRYYDNKLNPKELK